MSSLDRMNHEKLEQVRARIEQAELENEGLRLRTEAAESEAQEDEEAKPKPRRPRLKNLKRVASKVSLFLALSKKDDAEEEEEAEQERKLFLRGLKKQSELNDEEIVVVERFGLKCKVTLVQCGR